MAPSRRKSTHRRDAAAAARRKWKVGDLVLAKVKGFPAWPATVGEPEKWGHPADSKKVVVCFFGSEQIAFCNPADVEEFTEEKKVSLRGKRHGKGADFARAVDEIICCFEKLNKKDGVHGDNTTEENGDIIENGCQQSSIKSMKDEASVIAVKPLSTEATDDLNCLTEAALAVAAEESLHDEDMRVLEASPDLTSTGAPLPTSGFKRNRTNICRVNNVLVNRKSFKRRSASRVHTGALRNIVPPSFKSRRRSRRSDVNTRHLRRSTRIKRLSDDSESQAVESHGSMSDDSNGDSDSEIVSVESDTLSINDSSIFDSGSKPLRGNILKENNAGGMELGGKLDLQNVTVIMKKKRMPNRKRQSNDGVTSAQVDVVAPTSEVVKTLHVSPILFDVQSQSIVKENGDEHLPLVKRARVRMGRLSPLVKEESALVHEERSILNGPESPTAHSCDPLDCKADAFADRKSPCTKEDPENLSLSHASSAKKSYILDFRKHFADGEATLPPSKRIHRALEAMSANVAEDCERASDDLSAVSITSLKVCSELPNGKKHMVSDAVEIQGNSGSLLGSSDLYIVSNVDKPEADAKTMIITPECGKVGVCRTALEMQNVSFENVKDAETTCLRISPVSEISNEIGVELHVKPDLNIVRGELAPGLAICPTDLGKTGSPELNQAQPMSDPGISKMNLHSNFVEETSGDSPKIDNAICLGSTDGQSAADCRKSKCLSPESNQDSKRSPESGGEARPASLDSNALPFVNVTPLEVSDNGHHQPLISSISYEYMDDKSVSVTQSSSSVTDGPDSSARASPPCSSKCNISVTDNIYLHNNVSQSPCAQFNPEKSKLAGKQVTREDSLLTFESTIGSLTRTKDSIGRATRAAIDCAKFGFATKVMEILAHNLERETILHKKVNLFFLVDSITQCSRSMKGDGGVYLSSIQAMLPRLLLAAAPPGNNSNENHRQCLKVLRVWMERKILPEPIIRHHIKELEAFCCPYPVIGSRRPLRNERAFDDPVRQMEGMLVDEYGSNSSIQLAGFCVPPMLSNNDGRNDSDGESSGAPKPNVETLDREMITVAAVEKHSCILEDVEGELEMEDLAPCCDGETILPSENAGADNTQMPHHQSNNHNGISFNPQRSEDMQLTSAPSGSAPPPPPPHIHQPSVFPPAASADIPDSKRFPSSQNYNREFPESTSNHSVVPRVKPTSVGAAHHRLQDNGYFEAQEPRRLSDSCSTGPTGRPASHFSGRASNDFHPNDAFNKGFHWRPPQPSTSGQFSYVQERVQSRRDFPAPFHSNRLRTRNPENNNFYRHRDRNKFAHRDNSGDYWRPPFPYDSGPCYPDGGRMTHAPPLYGGPQRDSRWNCPPGPMSHHRHINHYSPHCEGPIPVENRGSDFWRPR